MNKAAINTKKPVKFYDGRNKTDWELVMEKVLYEDKKICLCTCRWELNVEKIRERGHTTDDMSDNDEIVTILFDKKERKVLLTDYYSFYGENYKIKK